MLERIGEKTFRVSKETAGGIKKAFGEIPGRYSGGVTGDNIKEFYEITKRNHRRDSFMNQNMNSLMYSRWNSCIN